MGREKGRCRIEINKTIFLRALRPDFLLSVGVALRSRSMSSLMRQSPFVIANLMLS